MKAPPVMFSPSAERMAASGLTAFARSWEARRGPLDPANLHEESVRDVEAFWEAFVAWSGVRLGGDTSIVLATPTGTDPDRAAIETVRFYPNATLSYVEELLDPPRAEGEAPLDPEQTVVIAADETGHVERVTRAALADRVRRVAASLRAMGVAPGDRVVGLCRLTADSLVAYLGTLAIGAVWSSAAPDMGTELFLARAGQVSPKVLFAHTEMPYHGTRRQNRERLAGLTDKLPSVERVVLFDAEPDGLGSRVAAEQWSALLRTPPLEGPLPRFPFNHPLLILFSSGTTGLPKCIVHGAGGTWLEHLKEHRLHVDLTPEDRLFYHTTTGWMMFNWLVSGLGAGAAIVLYDGSVSYPEPDALFRRVAELGVTVLGTSPVYLQMCKDSALEPKATLDLSRLRLLLSTGSVLQDPLYDWVRSNVGELPIHSISGGTDIVGCFVMGSPCRPVWRGESASLGLGLDVRLAVDLEGSTRIVGPPKDGEIVGDLVCAQPFPSRPIALVGDADGTRLHAAYYEENPGVWTHGDLAALTDRGTARILGRSDAVLNARGIRVGPGEIYRVIGGFPEVSGACAVEQRAPAEPGGSRVVLFVTMHERGTLARPLTWKIKKALSERASPAHVPAVIVEVSSLPRTLNGKVSERAARDAANGIPAKNRAALANPEVLDEIESHPEIACVRGES